MTSFPQKSADRREVLVTRNRQHRLATPKVLFKFGKIAFPIAFALAYAGILTSLPIDVFKDRHNYLIHADRSDLVLASYILRGWNVALFNEPAWRLINIFFDNFFDPEQTVRALIFIPAFIVPYVVLKNNPKHSAWLVLFLLLPDVIKFHIIQLRQGFAIAVFLAGYYAGPKWLRYSLMGAAGFVHSSFLVLGVIGGLSSTLRTLSLRLTPRMRILLFVIAFAILGAVLLPISTALGARQGERYMDWEVEISGLGLLFWLLIFSLYLSSGRDFILGNIFPIAILTFYLTTYGLPITSRVFQSGIILVLISGLFLHGWRRLAFQCAVAFYAIFSYLMRIDQPWLGWGAV